MLIPIHAEITTEALIEFFRTYQLNIIIRANLRQDGLINQIGHDEFHFDNNKIEASNLYIFEQRNLVIKSMANLRLMEAWQHFGRLLHSAQDFYAHSNYVGLWLKKRIDGITPSPEEIEPMEKWILEHPDLHSGKLYYPLEIFSFIPILREKVKRKLPKDAHAWMNLDSPKNGDNFPYVYSAAKKRTRLEFELIKEKLNDNELRLFTWGETDL